MNNTIRIDKYLWQLQLLSRREARKFFRSGRVLVNWYIEYDHGFQIIDGDRISIAPDYGLSQYDSQWKTIEDQYVYLSESQELLEFEVKQTVTILLHKPTWYVCSEIDEWGHMSYKHLLSDCIYAPMLNVAGRLDQDTTGLVLATSDGNLNHRIISPKSKKEKEYKVICEKEISDEDLVRLEEGVEIEPWLITLPAKAVRIDGFSFILTLIEGKYHQVKRMCEAVNNLCVSLHRTRIADWTGDDLAEGKWKFIDGNLFDNR